MKTPLFLTLTALAALAQKPEPDRVIAAMKERAMADQVARMKTDERIAFYQSLAETQPANLHYRNLLAATYLQKTRETTDSAYSERASKLLDQVLGADGSNYEARRLRTEIYLERHEFKKAIESSRTLTRVAPGDPWNWGTLGDALIEWGDYDGAAEAYQKMADLRPDLASYNRAAWYRFVAGDLNGALDLMRTAANSGSAGENLAWVLVELGNLQIRAARLDDAQNSFTAAAKVFPNYHPALAAQGRLAARAGRSAEAIALYKRAQAATPLPEYAAALHDLYREAGQPKEAASQLALLDTIDKLGQANGEKANRSLALIYADRNHKPARALELAKAELEFRQDVFTYDVLAWALYRNGRFEEAAEAMAKALKMETPEASFHYHAGLIAKALGKNADAVRHLRRALELNLGTELNQPAIARQTLAGLEPGS